MIKNKVLLFMFIIWMASCAESADVEPGEQNNQDNQAPSGKCNTPTVVISNAVERDEDGRGEITATNVCVPELGVIRTITLRYNMDTFFGEPTRLAVFSYEADFDISNAAWVAQVFTRQGEPVTINGRAVYAGWEEGTWAGPGEGFGSDSTGSPAWSGTFRYDLASGGEPDFVDAESAKQIYRNSFTLDKLRISQLNSSNDVLY